MRVIIYVMLCFLWIVSCNKEKEYYVDPVFKPFIDSFSVQAQLRNFSLGDKLEALNVTFTELDGNVAGQCRLSSSLHEIVIDSDQWNGMNQLERELLLYHELGHCILNRQHRDDKDSRGNCISIMRSSNSVCNLKYTLAGKKSLLDELFLF